MSVSEPGAPRGNRLKHVACLGLAGATLALAITVAWQSASLYRLDLAFTRTETELTFWGSADYQPTEATRVRTGRELDALLARAPDHPDYLALAAYYEAWLAYREDDPALAQPHALRAANAQFFAQQNRPAYRQGWAKMVRYARRAAADETARELGRFAQQRLDVLGFAQGPDQGS
jgi:hypothetical protein